MKQGKMVDVEGTYECKLEGIVKKKLYKKSDDNNSNSEIKK